MGIHDGAYNGRLHFRVPFIGHKTLSVWQKTHNDIHGYCRARVEYLFACLWSWRVVRNIWLGFREDFCCLCHMHGCFPEVGGFQGGHGEIELLFGAVPVLCPRCARTVQKHPPSALQASFH